MFRRYYRESRGFCSMKRYMRKIATLIGIACILAIELIASLSAITDLNSAAMSFLGVISGIFKAIIMLIMSTIIVCLTIGSLYYAIRRFMDVAYGYNALIHKHGASDNQTELDNLIKGIAGLIIPTVILCIAASVDIPMMMADGYQVAIVGAVYLIVTICAIKESFNIYRDPKQLAFLEKFEKGYYRDRIFN